MSVSIRWLSGPGAVLREHAEGAGFGSSARWSCTVERLGDVAILHAAPGAPRSFNDVRQALREAGFARVRWLRMDGRGWREFAL